MNLPMIGTAEKTSASRYQVMLTDEHDKTIPPINRSRINRFFESEADRNSFINSLEDELKKADCTLIKSLEHFCFVTVEAIDPQGNKNYSITIYR